jgi:hypothetical protein
MFEPKVPSKAPKTFETDNSAINSTYAYRRKERKKEKKEKKNNRNHQPIRSSKLEQKELQY